MPIFSTLGSWKISFTAKRFSNNHRNRSARDIGHTNWLRLVLFWSWTLIIWTSYMMCMENFYWHQRKKLCPMKILVVGSITFWEKQMFCDAKANQWNWYKHCRKRTAILFIISHWSFMWAVDCKLRKYTELSWFSRSRGWNLTFHWIKKRQQSRKQLWRKLSWWITVVTRKNWKANEMGSTCAWCLPKMNLGKNHLPICSSLSKYLTKPWLHLLPREETFYGTNQQFSARLSSIMQTMICTTFIIMLWSQNLRVGWFTETKNSFQTKLKGRLLPRTEQ